MKSRKKVGQSRPNGDTEWAGALGLIAALEAMDAPLRGRLRAAFERHDKALAEIGVDPLANDWTSFRPLRLSREEDWSDWLAWLLENSQSGTFAAAIFQRRSEDSVKPKVEREALVGQHRIDLRMQWRTSGTRASAKGASTALEVKVGDQEFAKTASAAKAHKRDFQTFHCEDWILVPAEHQESCAVAGARVLTWNDVAMALRRCLRERGESIAWRVWASTFLGAVEQKLLGFPHEEQFGRALDISGCVKHLEESDGD